MTDQLESTEKHVGRRAVVRTAAHAAWAIPAIQVATTVSANAATCSGGQPTNLSISAGSLTFGSGSDSKKFTKTCSVTNMGGGGSAIVRVTPSQALKAGTAPVATDASWIRSGTGPSWNFTKVIGSCAGNTMGGTAVPAVTFQVTGEFANNGGSPTVSAVLV